MKSNECEGCLSNVTNPYIMSECVFQKSNENLNYKCPCGICLIKCICERACEEYKAIRKKQIDEINITRQHKKEFNLSWMIKHIKNAKVV